MLTKAWLSLVLVISTGNMMVHVNEYPFFPFYLTSEYDRLPESFVLVNVTIRKNASGILLNGLSTNMHTYTTSDSHDIIVFPTMGYYLRSSSSLEIKIQTKVETTTFKYNNVYQVLSGKDIGYTYYVSTVEETSEEFMCAAQAPLGSDLTLNITFPRKLQSKVVINNKLIDKLKVVLFVKKGQAVKFNSSHPLRHVILKSTSNSFSVFCAEKNVRYQLKPISQCGNIFRFSCVGFSNVTGCKVSLTSTTSEQNTLTILNSIGLTKQTFYTGHFFSLNLTTFEGNIELHSKQEICVLLTLYSYENDFIWTSVKAIPSLSNYPTTSFDNSTELLTTKTSKSHQSKSSMKIERTTKVKGSDSSSYTSPLIQTSKAYTRHLSSFFSGKIMYSSGNHPVSKLQKFQTSNLPKLVTLRPFDQTALITHYLSLLTSSNFLAKPNAYEYQKSTTFSVLSHSSVKSNHYTTSMVTNNKSSTEGQCVCSPGEYCIEIQQETIKFSTLEEKLIQVKSFLMVNKSSLNSFIRRKSCAADERLSSRTLGYIGIIVISVFLGSIVACDLFTIFEGRFKFM